MFPRVACACFLAILLVFCGTTAFAGKVELTTYYPAPYGEYKELKATDTLTLGTTASSTVPRLTILGGDPTNLVALPGGYTLNYSKSTSNNYGFAFNWSSGQKESFYLVSGPNFRQQCLYFGNDSMTGNIFGISTKEYGSYPWKAKFVVTEDGNVGLGTNNPTKQLTLSGIGGVIGMDNQSSFSAKNKNGVYEEWMWPRFSDGNVDATVLNFGDGGWWIRNNTSTVIMTMWPNGNVGIGEPYPQNLLYLKGGAHCDGTGSWAPGSDRAYKKDINYDFTYGLKTVEQLKPVFYVHKLDKKNKKQIGFIAQDVKSVIPEVVDGEEGSYGLSYDRITAVLVNAVKEQQQQIDLLKKEVAELKKK